MFQSRVGGYGGEKRSATGRRNHEPKDPTHRRRPLRISQARLWRRKIEVTERPHDTISSVLYTISSVRFTKHKRVLRCGGVKIGKKPDNDRLGHSTFQPRCSNVILEHLLRATFQPLLTRARSIGQLC